MLHVPRETKWTLIYCLNPKWSFVLVAKTLKTENTLLNTWSKALVPDCGDGYVEVYEIKSP